jgi:hypothetical protein
MLRDVAAYRGLPAQLTTAQRGAQLGGGAVFIGAAAVTRGLADRLGAYEALHAELAGGRLARRRPRVAPDATAPRLVAAGSGAGTRGPTGSGAPGAAAPPVAPAAALPVPPLPPNGADVAARILANYAKLHPGKVVPRH